MTLVQARPQLRIGKSRSRFGNYKGLSLRTKEIAFIEIALLLFLMITSQSTAAEDK